MMYDLAVIGGGINGAAIARDAALRGLLVCLFEKKDFGAGASTKTSKLVHGGLRYLEGLELGLVRESLQERTLLFKNASHLVKPLPFILPVYAKDRHPLWKVHLGLYLYDFLARNGGVPAHQKLTSEPIKQSFPDLSETALQGGCLYYDGLMKDNRLLIETLVSAEKAGAAIFNYTQVVRIQQNTTSVPSGVVFVKDSQTEKETSFDARVIVNATGAWINDIATENAHTVVDQVMPSKGVHVVIPQISADQALLLQAPQDGRVFFVIPWEGKSLVGTTDTFYNGSLEDVEANSCDITYLLDALKHYFPSLNLSKDTITSSFAGLRPLVNERVNGTPSDISRRHMINHSAKGMITVSGGKYTTHRKIAQEVVDIVIQDLGKQDIESFASKTALTPLPGVLDKDSEILLKSALENEGLSDIQVEHLIENYGKNAWEILNIMRRYPEEKNQICSFHPHVFAELTYAIEIEHVKNPEDWFYRRTSIAYVSECKGERCYNQVLEKLQAHTLQIEKR